MGFDVNQLFAEISKEDVFFAYEGEITSERINTMLEDIEGKLSNSSIDGKTRKKIYNIMVESLQNLFHHADEVPQELKDKLGDRYGIVVVKKMDDCFKLTVGNYVLSDKVKYLTEKIEKINSLSSDELKEMYKFILNYQKLSSKGGGGLGLIDIARKSERKLEYKFYPDEQYYFYRLDIFVSI
jgi:hypothetical protein